MRNNIAKFIVVGSLAVVLTSCGNSKDANKSNFSKAIQTYLDTEPGICASIPAEDTPFVLNSDGINYSILSQFADALVDAGLLNKRATEVKPIYGKKMVPANEYQITDEGKKFLVPHAPNIFGKRGAFCAGKYAMVEVDNFTEPNNANGMTISQVNFRYTLNNLPDWAKKESMRKAFDNFQKETQGEIKEQTTLILTNDGWVHLRLFGK